MNFSVYQNTMNKNTETTIGGRLKMLREGADLTQAELAKKAGISLRTLRLIERGESNPPIHVALLICKALEIYSLDALFLPPGGWDSVKLPEEGTNGIEIEKIKEKSFIKRIKKYSTLKKKTRK